MLAGKLDKLTTHDSNQPAQMAKMSYVNNLLSVYKFMMTIIFFQYTYILIYLYTYILIYLIILSATLIVVQNTGFLIFE